METTRETGILRFLRDCYEADNREAAIWDLLDPRIRHLQFALMGGQWLSGAIDRVPVERGAALEAAREAALNRAEKSLVFAAFFVVGAVHDAVRGKRRRICAPLVFFPAEIEDDPPHAFVRIRSDERRLNLRVLGELAGDATALDDFAAGFPKIPLPEVHVDDLKMVLREVFPDLDLKPLDVYPGQIDEADLRALAQRRGSGLSVVPATALALIPNSPDTRDVLAEMADLAQRSDLSPPLKGVLVPGPSRDSRGPKRHRVPAALSRAQRGALHSAAVNDLTLLVGPPGTGKSFTVACIALDAALRGESVLIASKMDQAVDVVRDKIAAIAGEGLFVVRGGRGSYSRDLKAAVGDLLAGFGGGHDGIDRRRVNELAAEVDRLQTGVDRREKRLLRRAERETRWGEFEDLRSRSGTFGELYGRQRQRLLEWTFKAPYWHEVDQYRHALARLHRAMAAWLRAATGHRIRMALERHRTSFVALDKVLRSRTQRKLREYFAEIDLRVLFEALPIWMTTLADAAQMAPLESGLFDLVIVDEATQCDPVSALPVLQRGRRAIVTGDPKQLRHVSFLSEARLRTLAERRGVDDRDLEAWHYRRKSLLDVVSDGLVSQRQVVFLDEHFRSRPGIIAFSNREFYNRRLRVMTRRPETEAAFGIRVRHERGHRDGSGVNRAEVEAVLDEIATRISDQRSLSADFVHSIGVVSPFRKQVEAISKAVARRFEARDLERHRIRVATAHGFQGEERDVMLISLVLDDASPAGAMRFLNRPDVFNVAITRARTEQVLLCSLTDDVDPPGLLGRYLDFAGRKGPARNDAGPVDDGFLHAVSAQLEVRGCRVWPAYRVAGMEVDLVVESGGASIAVDLVGAPGRFADAFDLDAYRMFERAGLRLVPLPISAWQRSREACLLMLESALRRA